MPPDLIIGPQLGCSFWSLRDWLTLVSVGQSGGLTLQDATLIWDTSPPALPASGKVTMSEQ